MRSIVVYILLFAVLLPMVSQWGTIAYFHVNRDYIARVLCQNRDKPQLNCNGQCYLAKQLKSQQDKQDKETTERIQNLPVLQWFCHEQTAFVFLPPFWLPAQRVDDYLLSTYTAPLDGMLMPPRLG
jgi:hypothetical protein